MGFFDSSSSGDGGKKEARRQGNDAYSDDDDFEAEPSPTTQPQRSVNGTMNGKQGDGHKSPRSRSSSSSSSSSSKDAGENSGIFNLTQPPPSHSPSKPRGAGTGRAKAATAGVRPTKHQPKPYVYTRSNTNGIHSSSSNARAGTTGTRGKGKGSGSTRGSRTSLLRDSKRESSKAALPSFDKEALAQETTLAAQLTTLQRDNTMLARRKADSYGTLRLLETTDRLKELDGVHKQLIHENEALKIVTGRQKKEIYGVKRVVLGPDVELAEQELHDLRETHASLRDASVNTRKQMNQQNRQIDIITKRIQRLTGIVSNMDTMAQYTQGKRDFENRVDELQRKIDLLTDEKERSKKQHVVHMKKTRQMLQSSMAQVHQLEDEMLRKDQELRDMESALLGLDKILSPEKKHHLAPGETYVPRQGLTKEARAAQRAKVMLKNSPVREQYREGFVGLQTEIMKRDAKKDRARKSLAQQFTTAVASPHPAGQFAERPRSSPRLTPLNFDNLSKLQQQQQQQGKGRSQTSIGHYAALPNQYQNGHAVDIAAVNRQAEQARYESPHGARGPQPIAKKDSRGTIADRNPYMTPQAMSKSYPVRHRFEGNSSKNGNLFLTQGVDFTPSVSARYGPAGNRPGLFRQQDPPVRQGHLQRSREGLLG